MAQKKSEIGSIHVEILGSTYSLRGGSDPQAVRSLAEELDARMRALAAAAPGADPVKVAVLAGLRLADESRAIREGSASREHELAGRIGACIVRLERALQAETGGTERTNASLDAERPLR